jgi:hypothetical protein
MLLRRVRQNLRTELLLVLRAPTKSPCFASLPNKLVYHALTPAHIAATIQGHARPLGIEKHLATKDKDTHLVHNLGDEDSSSAVPSGDNPNDELDFDVIRALKSQSSSFFCGGKDHRVATYPQLMRIKGNDLAMRVCVAAIGPRRDSRQNDSPPRKDARPRQDARPRPDRHPQKVRDDRSSCAESVASDFHRLTVSTVLTLA